MPFTGEAAAAPVAPIWPLPQSEVPLHVLAAGEPGLLAAAPASPVAGASTTSSRSSAMGSAASIGSMWLNSPAHRAALLDPSIRWIGLAVYGSYWTFNAY